MILKISSLTSKGEGIGSFDGLKIFVDGALPNETVSVKIIERKKTYAKAELISIIKSSEERITPLCPVFGECGGCQVMHLEYSAQLNAKKQRIQAALQRIGGLHDLVVLPCIPSPSDLNYRNKIQLPVIWDNHKKIIGLYRKKSHDVIPINRCFIQCMQGGRNLISN